jgi:high-affinity iron transporter
MKSAFIILGMVLGLASGGCRSAPPPAVSRAKDGGEAQRLVTLVDYIGGDYKRAVEGGKVVSAAEYEEQERFAADAVKIAESLARPEPEASRTLLAALAEVQAKVAEKADPALVAAACKAAREEVVVRFSLRTMPAERPALARAQSLYTMACAKCHGEDGSGDTPRARELDPAPAKFKDPARLGDLSPYRIYNTLTFGVTGTAMASFEDLSPAERWSLAFYVFRLAHEGEDAQGPAAMTLADMASRTDREILDILRQDRHPAPQKGLVFVRREAAFTEAPTGLGVDRTRAMLRRALRAYEEGRESEADHLVIDAYLEGFEPLEPRLRARDAAGTVDVESAFRDLRGAMASSEPADRVRARGRVLDERLLALADGRRPVVPLAAAFIVYFREGVEAALLVAALLACLRRLGRADAARFIHAGWIAALPAGVATWFVFDRLLAIGADQRELLEGIVALLAATVLFSVSFWLVSKAESKHWMDYLRQKLESGLTRGSLIALSSLSFLAVYREAAETVLFTQAILIEAPGQGARVWMGAGLGLLAVVGAALVLNRTVLRLPLGPFFAVSSALLCALAVSFAGSGIYALVTAGYLPPRPVAFPEVPWMGIHPDLTGLLVQLAIVGVIVGAAVSTLRRASTAPEHGAP